MKPSIGRIVHYREGTKEPVPLLVTHVHSDTVVSGVRFTAFGSPVAGAVTSVEFDEDGEREFTWCWPPRV